MKIVDSTPLDEAWNDPANILFFVFGDSNPLAQVVHDTAETLTAPWEKVFWVVNGNALSPEERVMLLLSNDTYTIWSCPDQAVKATGLLASLCSDGQASARLIRTALDAAEAS